MSNDISISNSVTLPNGQTSQTQDRIKLTDLSVPQRMSLSQFLSFKNDNSGQDIESEFFKSQGNQWEFTDKRDSYTTTFRGRFVEL